MPNTRKEVRGRDKKCTVLASDLEIAQCGADLVNFEAMFSGCVSDPDPHSMAAWSWIRIRIPNTDPGGFSQIK
jgi:hypothetical protein